MIIKAVRETGFATIEALARQFDVTPQTIRRDINTLSRDGRLNRYHGGAALSSSTENVDYSSRKVICLKEKQAIAREAARLIPNNASLFVNIGTTTEEVARALCNHKKLKIITNNLNVALIFSGIENFEIIVAGGMLRHKDNGIVGMSSIDFIRQFKVDYGVIGISGIDMDGTLLDFDYREVRAARTIMDNSRQVILVADHTKFGRNAMVRLGSLTEIDSLITDREPPPGLAEVITGADVQLVVAAPGK
jgi:DeoR family glycerol-3-phosphate regulon repressor